MAEVACFPGTDVPVTSYLAYRAPDLTAHYWAVAGVPDGHHREDIRETVSRVFSSAAAAYVPVTDPAYVTWLAAGNAATPIDTEANLDAVLMPYGVGTGGRFRLETGYALLTALTDAQRDLYPTVVKGWDQRRLSLRGADHIPENNPLIARVAPLLKTTPAAWYDAVRKPAS